MQKTTLPENGAERKAERAIFTRDSRNLDFLRSIAVMCVFGRHIVSWLGDPQSPWFQPQVLGIFGVLAFFVHTSLVLMLSLERQDRDNTHGFGRLYESFMIRRAFRIYPLAMLIVLLCWFVLPAAASDLGRVTQDTATLVSNLLLLKPPYVYGVLWTLPLELQMYVFLPFLYLLVRRIGGLKLLAMWPLVVVASFLIRYHTHLPPVFGYVPCFVAGVIAYRLPSVRNRWPFWTLPVVIAITLALYMRLYARTHWEVPLGWFVCIAFGVTLPQIKPMKSVWLAKVSKVIATYSYGIYLTHIISMWIAFKVLSLGSTAAQIGLSIVLCAIFSVASYHLIEHPFVQLGIKMGQAVTDARMRRQAKAAEPAAP